MAVTTTVAELAAALRLGDSAEETAEATRLLGYATEAVTKHLGTAFATTPDAVANEAVIRLAGYLFDQPFAARSSGFANALRNSGAARMLLPYRVHGAGTTAEATAAAQEAIGTAGNPVISVIIDAGQLVVTLADGTTSREDLPAGMGGGTVDQTAREAAAAAIAAAAANTQALAGKQNTLMPPSPAEAAGGTATTIRGWTAALIRVLVEAVVPQWARDDHTLIPGSKLADSLRGTKVFVQDAAPSSSVSAEGDIWLRDLTTTHPQIYERNSGAWIRDYSFYGGRVHLVTNPIAVNVDFPIANGGDIALEFIDGTLKLFRRLASPPPYWRLDGTVSGGTGGASVYLGAYSNLTAEQAAGIDLGHYTLFQNRYWICHDREQARANAPGTNPNDGWRPIDGQYRGQATVGQRYYDAGDHTRIGSTVYFCEAEGIYSRDDILTSPNWAGPGTLDQTARDAAAAAAAQATTNAQAIAGIGSTGTARTEVLIPFRPGSRPGAILIESTGYVVAGVYTAYGVPHYVAAAGGFTATVNDAQDFSGETHIRRLIDGGDIAVLRELPDEPTIEGLTGIFRDDNSIEVVSSRPSAIINLHFIQNVGGSRYFNPDDRVARFPHGGEATPDFNAGHQWIAGLGIIAIGDEKRIELITDGDQPGGTLRVSLGLPGDTPVEHLVVPLVTDPNTYHSGLVSNIPDGQDLEFSITNNGNIRILHDGLHFERFILEEELEARLVPLQGRVAGLEDVEQPAPVELPAWHWAAFANAAFVPNTAKAVSFRTFPIGPYADYAAIRAAILNGSITQIAIYLQQNDPGDGDDDGGVFVIPNLSPFKGSGIQGQFRAFPAWNIGVNPAAFRATFEAGTITIEADTAISATPFFRVNVGIYA